MTRNTHFSYMYRDADNYKVTGFAVFSGECSLELRDRIIRTAIDPEPDGYGSFVPGQVGLPDLQNLFHKAEIGSIDALIASARDGAGPVKNHVPEEDLARFEALRDDLSDQRPCWDPQRDHPFHEILDIHLTQQDPTDPRSIEDFAEAMEAVRWDPDYLPPFHAEMLANFEEKQARETEDALEPGGIGRPP